MKRITVLYDGLEYSIGEEDYDALKAAISDSLDNGVATWLRVNHGEGRPQQAEILIGPGIPVALLPIDGEE